MRANLIAALIGMLCVVGCGGGGSSVAGGGGGGASGSNVQPVTVDSGPTLIANSNSPAVNTLYTSVTVCSPGNASNCQTIDHIQVDTGSSGLRILASALSISLPLQQDSNGNTIAECVQFVDGSSWGPLRQADVKISGEMAASQHVHVIGDAAYPTIPTACIGTGTAENTVTAFGANGILGVGAFIEDCGPGCTQGPAGIYYICPTSSTCSDSALPLALQVANPVASFTTDNNGVIIELPTVSATGVSSVSGSLIFGIGTQGNNGLASATVFPVDGMGSLKTTYKGTTLTRSFIDSGSNAYYFPDPSIFVCGSNGSNSSAPGFFCPNSTLNLTATILGVGAGSAQVDFSVANAETLFSGSTVIAAVSTLAGSSTSVSSSTTPGTFDGTNSFDWGLPFYFGRSVYTAIETRNTAGGMGPYFAF